MAVRHRGESLTWGLVILFFGILLQVHFLRPELRILHNLWKFWPVLIIAMGVNKLFRYYSGRRSEGGGAER